MDRRSRNGLDSSYLGRECVLLISGDGATWMRDALRKSGVTFSADLDGRNRECCCCFRKFTADLQEITNAGSGNADPVLGFCKQFARNGALSNGGSENPS